MNNDYKQRSLGCILRTLPSQQLYCFLHTCGCRVYYNWSYPKGLPRYTKSKRGVPLSKSPLSHAKLDTAAFVVHGQNVHFCTTRDYSNTSSAPTWTYYPFTKHLVRFYGELVQASRRYSWPYTQYALWRAELGRDKNRINYWIGLLGVSRSPF